MQRRASVLAPVVIAPSLVEDGKDRKEQAARTWKALREKARAATAAPAQTA